MPSIWHFLPFSIGAEATPMAPWGLIPTLLIWGSLGNAGLTLIFLTGALWALGSTHAWQGLIRKSSLGLLLGVSLLLIGGGAHGTLQTAERSVAAYSILQILQGKVQPKESLPTLDRHGMPLALYGKYSAFYHRPEAPLPEWVRVRQGEGSVQVICVDEFVLLYPPDRILTLPEQFEFAVDPEKWGYMGAINFYDPEAGLVISEELLRSGLSRRDRWGMALMLAKASGFKAKERKWPGFLRLHKALGQFHPALYIGDPYAAWLVLQYWQQGEGMGHENFIREMVTGAKDHEK